MTTPTTEVSPTARLYDATQHLAACASAHAMTHRVPPRYAHLAAAYDEALRDAVAEGVRGGGES